MLLKELCKEEPSFTMGVIGVQYVVMMMIQISARLQLTFSADLSIRDLELLDGQVFNTCPTPDIMILVMDI